MIPMFIQYQDSVYRRKVYLFVGTRKDFIAHLTEKWGKQSARGVPKDAIGLMHTFKYYREDYAELGKVSKIFYIWLTHFENTPLGIATLAHECLHCASSVLSYLAVDTSDEDGSESLTYYMDSLIEQSLTALKGGA